MTTPDNTQNDSLRDLMSEAIYSVPYNQLKPGQDERVDYHTHLIEQYGYEQRMLEHELFQKWLYDPAVGVGTIDVWSQGRVESLERLKKGETS